MTDNFIRQFIQLHEGTEVPDTFSIWAAFGAISASLGRRLYIDMGHYQIYPNVYIVLVAGSGQKKSTAINSALKLVKLTEPKPNLISQKVTPEMLIKLLRQSVSCEILDPTKPEDIVLRDECVGFAFVDEFANFLNKQNYEGGMGQLLTPLWDAVEEFEYATLSRGRELLHRVCFGILGGATIDWLQNAVPMEAVGGGVTSRFIFVFLDSRPPPQAITSWTEEKKEVYTKLISHIQRIGQLRGEIKLTEHAWKLYKEEYDKFYLNSPFWKDRNLSGYANRRAVHLLKLAMLISVSDSSSLIIEDRHFKTAQAFLEQAELSMPIVLSLITSTKHGADVSKIYTSIRQSGAEGISRSTLLRQYAHQLTSKELAEIIGTLIHARKIISQTKDSEVRYYPTKI